MTAAPAAVEQVVARLLVADTGGDPMPPSLASMLPPDSAPETARRLLDEAERLIGVDPRRMEYLCRAAVDLAERAGDRYLWAMARFKQGEACIHQDRNAEGRTYLDEAEAAFLALDCPVEAARTRIIWVWATANLGGDREALRAARIARRTLHAHGQSIFVATLDMNTGLVHCMRGRLRTGARYFRTSLALYESLDQDVRAERVRQNLGLALSRLGQYKEALPVLDGARESARRGGRTRTYALCARAVGETHLRLGRYAAALRAFEEAQGIAESLALDDGALTLATNLADCYLRLNRPADALTVLGGIDHLGDRIDTAELTFEFASRRIAAYLLLDRRAEALVALDDVASRPHAGAAEDRAWLAGMRAAALFAGGETAEALRVAQGGAAIARRAGLRPQLADLRINEGLAFLAEGDLDGAQRAAIHARRIGRAQDAAPLIHRAEELLGRIAEQRGFLSAAIRHYNAAIVQFEREQSHVIFEHRDRFAARHTSAYERLGRLQLERGSAIDALVTAERAKSRALLDSITGITDLRPRGSGIVRRLTRELTGAREEYAATHSLLVEGAASGDADPECGQRLRARLDQLETTINDLIRRLQLQGTAADVADILGVIPSGDLPRLPADTTLIEFFIADGQILRFTIGGDIVRGDALPSSVAEIERLLAMLRLNLDATARSSSGNLERLSVQAQAILTRLNDLLFSGLAIPPHRRSLVVVPHGILHYIPFHALHDGHRYLVEQYAISYAPSAALYDLCRGRTHRRRRGTSLVLGHSAGGRLAHTIDEAAQISTVLAGSLHQEHEATRAVLARQGRRAAIIHIAAHGEFRPDAPLFSYLQLADGPLTTADVFSMDLQAGLVTLSACETGQAIVGGGDELVGLSRAFLYAGTAALMVSQWRVDDASTASLMTRFYGELNRGAGPAQALRQAQRALILGEVPQSHWAHPFFWASFQLVGAT